MTVAEHLHAASRRLAPRSPSARLDAELLLGHALDLSRAALLAREERPVAASNAARFDALIERRAAGEPVAYLLGTKGFWSLELRVTTDVLIPRPETETLVGWVLELAADSPKDVIPAKPAPACSRRGAGIQNDELSAASGKLDSRLRGNNGVGAPLYLLDLGTGSGAIALALAGELPDARVVATDCSDAAIAIARDNAERNQIFNLEFVLGSWFAALDPTTPRFDFILSNPPYIAEYDAHLRDLGFEPRAALVAGRDGLDALRLIVGQARDWLTPAGWLLVEHGFEQGAAVRALFVAAGFAGIETRRDFGGNERVTAGQAR